jgi:hypothetical protein
VTEPSSMGITTTLNACVPFVLLYLQCHNAMASQEVVMAATKDGNEHSGVSIDLAIDWEVLGPFQIGTRGVISSVRVSR